MTKKKLHETIMGLCEEHNVSDKFKNAIDELTKPKAGGSSDVNDYTVFDEAGQPVYIFCAYHKRWEPVVTENEDGEEVSLFTADEKSKNGFKRSCDEGDKQWREQAKEFNASKNAIVEDLLAENISGAEATDQLAECEAARKVHKEREDGLGTEERPEV